MDFSYGEQKNIKHVRHFTEVENKPHKVITLLKCQASANVWNRGRNFIKEEANGVSSPQIWN